MKENRKAIEIGNQQKERFSGSVVLGYGLNAGGRYIKEYSGDPVVEKRVGPARFASLGRSRLAGNENIY
jgi:hypothetical protein